MTLGIQDILTVAGATVIVLILVGVIKSALPNFDSARFGAALAIGLGILIVAGANYFVIAEVRLDWGSAILTGILAGASAAGVYDAGKGLSRGGTDPVPEG